MSDPSIPDIDRTGDDLLSRIDELTVGKIADDDKDGWRCLMLAAGREIRRLRAKPHPAERPIQSRWLLLDTNEDQ